MPIDPRYAVGLTPQEIASAVVGGATLREQPYELALKKAQADRIAAETNLLADRFSLDKEKTYADIARGQDLTLLALRQADLQNKEYELRKQAQDYLERNDTPTAQRLIAEANMLKQKNELLTDLKKLGLQIPFGDTSLPAYLLGPEGIARYLTSMLVATGKTNMAEAGDLAEDAMKIFTERSSSNPSEQYTMGDALNEALLKKMRPMGASGSNPLGFKLVK